MDAISSRKDKVSETKRLYDRGVERASKYLRDVDPGPDFYSKVRFGKEQLTKYAAELSRAKHGTEYMAWQKALNEQESTIREHRDLTEDTKRKYELVQNRGVAFYQIGLPEVLERLKSARAEHDKRQIEHKKALDYKNDDRHTKATQKLEAAKRLRKKLTEKHKNVRAEEKQKRRKNLSMAHRRVVAAVYDDALRLKIKQYIHPYKLKLDTAKKVQKKVTDDEKKQVSSSSIAPTNEGLTEILKVSKGGFLAIHSITISASLKKMMDLNAFQIKIKCTCCGHDCDFDVDFDLKQPWKVVFAIVQFLWKMLVGAVGGVFKELLHLFGA